MALFACKPNHKRLKNPVIKDMVLHGKVIVFFIARLDPPIKRQDYGEHPFNGLFVGSPLGSFLRAPVFV